MSKISDLELGELLQLKDATSTINNSIANKLTDYALINKDAYFNNIPNELKGDYERRIKYTHLIEAIEEEIARRVNEYL